MLILKKETVDQLDQFANDWTGQNFDSLEDLQMAIEEINLSLQDTEEYVAFS